MRSQGLKRALAATAEDRRVREPRQCLHSSVTHLPASIIDGEGDVSNAAGRSRCSSEAARLPRQPATKLT